MNYRLFAQRWINVYRQDALLFKQRPKLYLRYMTTNTQTQLSAPTRRWILKRYVALVGIPIASVLFYRLSTSFETRRKHGIVLGSIRRAIR